MDRSSRRNSSWNYLCYFLECIVSCYGNQRLMDRVNVVSVNAPPKLAATAQGLLSGFYEGLGSVTGTLIGGLMYDSYGPKMLFTSTSIALFVSWALFLVLQFSRVFSRKPKEVVEEEVIDQELVASKMSIECVELDENV